MEVDVSLLPTKTIQYLSLQLLSYFQARIYAILLNKEERGSSIFPWPVRNDVLPLWLETGGVLQLLPQK